MQQAVLLGFSLAALASLPWRVVSCPGDPAVAEAAVLGVQLFVSQLGQEYSQRVAAKHRPNRHC